MSEQVVVSCALHVVLHGLSDTDRTLVYHDR